MKKIKSLLMVVGLLAALSVTAVEPKSFSFMAVKAIYLTNTFNPTNLLTAGNAGSNIVGMTWTNNAVRFIHDGTNQTRVNPFKDVPLWSLSDGQGAWSTGSTNGLLNYHITYATVSITWTVAAAADTAVPFVLTPVYGVSSDNPNGYEATSAGDQWTFSFTPPGTATTETVITNAPLWRWPGAQKLRIRRVVNPDTTASSQIILRDISINGYPP